MNNIIIFILVLLVLLYSFLNKKYNIYIEAFIERLKSLLKYYYNNLLHNHNNLDDKDINNRLILSKYYFVSFGGPTQNYYNAVNRIHSQINNLKIFDYNIKYTDIDLKNDIEFWQKHGKFIENNKRGYGYWLWKPYIILKTLNKMQNDDILLYADAGCEIIMNPTKMKQLFKKCHMYDILYTSSYHKVKRWTKRDLLNYLNMDNSYFINSIQSQAGVILIKKNNKNCNIINEWYNIASNNYNFIDDSPSTLQNYNDFVEHRHDQTIFSLLTKKYNLNYDNNILHVHEPIIIARHR